VSEPETSTLRHYVDVLWRRRWFLLVPLVGLPIAAYVAESRQRPVYEVSAQVLLNHQDQVATSLVGVQTPVEDPGRYAQTQTLVATTPTLVRRVLAAAGEPRRSVTDFLNHSDVYSNSDVLVLSVRGNDAAQTIRLAGAYAREFAAYRRMLDTRDLAQTLAQLESRIAKLRREGGSASALAASLSAKAQDVRLLEALRRSNVYVIRTPSSDDADRIAPRPLRTTAMAAAVGLMLGVVAAFLAEALDARVRSALELEEALGLPLLGRVRLRGGAAGENDTVLALRTRLDRVLSPGPGRTLMLGGAAEDGGAAGVAAELARAFARAGRRVSVVDLDLRRSALTRLLGLAARPGVSTVMAGDATLEDALAAVPLGAGAAGELRALPAGAPPHRPGELAASAEAAALLKDVRGRSDDLFVAVPPLLVVGDAASLAPAGDALVLAVPSRGVRRPDLHELRRTLADWPVPLLGFVLTTGDERRPWSALRGDRREEPAGTRRSARAAAAESAR